MIHSSRVHLLNDKPRQRGRYILYWMQQSQRADWNHALEYAIELANAESLPLLTAFSLVPAYPEANRRHYVFMLQGLQEVELALKNRGIRMVIRQGNPVETIPELAASASAVVVDGGYLRVQREWRASVAARLRCCMWEVESDVCVPVAEVSSKEEFSAATIRPKLLRVLNEYLIPLQHRSVKKDSLTIRSRSLDIGTVDRVIDSLKIDCTVREVGWIRGGPSHAQERLATFLASKLDTFALQRNDPSRDNLSNLSPYLHFGQVSPLQIALEVRGRKSPGSASFLEELIIRRELSMNFVNYHHHYDSFAAIPDWARRTLDAHRADKRPALFTPSQLETASTYDPYWNAAQRELVYLGKMHGYMRMYWGKKIIEWTSDPESAHRLTLYLNDKYSLDGRDANGYTGVAWCFGKHDRAWGERPVFGKVRYMNDRGLRRKFDVDAYVCRVEERIRQEEFH